MPLDLDGLSLQGFEQVGASASATPSSESVNSVRTHSGIDTHERRLSTKHVGIEEQGVESTGVQQRDPSRPWRRRRTPEFLFDFRRPTFAAFETQPESVYMSALFLLYLEPVRKIARSTVKQASSFCNPTESLCARQRYQPDMWTIRIATSRTCSTRNVILLLGL